MNSNTYAIRLAFIRNDYINFGDFVRKEIGIQCQYASHYLCGDVDGYPNLGHGLRYTGKEGDYHSIMIDKQDAQVFEERYNAYKKEMNCL
jgi:hypothetical protein